MDDSGIKMNTAHGETVTFDPVYHTYTSSRGDRLTSVTKLLSGLFPPFDRDGAAIRTAMKTGKTKEEIIAAWEAKGADACRVGTHAHLIAESMFLDRSDPGDIESASPDDKKIYEMIRTAVDRLKSRWKFLMAEYLVFSPTFRVAGQIDLIMFESIIEPSRSVRMLLFDWKTCKSIDGSDGGNPYRKFMHDPVSHLPATKFMKYALQLRVYERVIHEMDCATTSGLEHYSGSDCAIIHVHHSLDRPRMIHVPRLDDEVTAILEYHRSSIASPARSR